jgi:3',5'-cyclic AMP phosphodiesterase CpdA
VWDRLELYPSYRTTLAQVGIPWYNLPGNHDVNDDAKVDEQSDETYEANFGPPSYAFNQGSAHFIILDNILWPDPQGQRHYRGGFRPDQFEFIENDLKHVARDQLVVLAFHIPLMKIAVREADRLRLFELLRNHSNVLVLSAHTHYQAQFFHGRDAGWPHDKPLHEYNAGTTCGDWHSGELDARGLPDATMVDGTPKGFAFLRVNGNQYTIDYQVAGQPPGRQISIFTPKFVARGRRTLAGIYANFYMGHAGSKVEYRIDDGKWIAMTHVKEQDPSFESMTYKWDLADELLAGRRPSRPAESTHLWRGEIPVNLPLGTHRIEVRATDMFGRTFTQLSSYQLADQDFQPR